MKLRKLAISLVLIALVGCECDESLHQICPLPQPCYVPAGLQNNQENMVVGLDLERVKLVGICQLGETACDKELNLYCEGYTTSSKEICDGLDNDCDGEVDEGFDKDGDGFKQCDGDCNDNNPNVNPSAEELCNGRDDNCDGVVPLVETNDLDSDGVVACRDCNDNNSDQSPNLEEICDLIDNDCDGVVDNIDQNITCGPSNNRGQCHRGYLACVDGEEYCIGATFESPEVCDGIDNNCNGIVDESVVRECNTDCGIGIEFCTFGEWGGCTAPSPETEICDGIDNDCNGEADEGCSCIVGDMQVCAENTIDRQTLEVVGCGMGIKECLEGGEWSPCFFAFPTEEVCNNYDDDCDGTIDDITQECSAGAIPYEPIGECSLGTATCTEGQWSSCVGGVGPADEICNRKDDNCNGEIDENLNSHDKVDMVFALDGSGSMCAYAFALAQGIGEYVQDFEETEHMFSLVIFPYQYGQSNGEIPWIVVTDLVDVNQFLAILNSVDCNYPSNEPSYDVMYDMSSVANPMGISWRNDAKPYLILMTDEPAASWMYRNEITVAQSTTDCRVGNCESGDRFEVYVFTDPIYFSMWDYVTFHEPGRLISISPPDSQQYANKLRTVFTNVCF